MNKKSEFVAMLSLDWGDKGHVGCLQVTGSDEIEEFKLEQKAWAIEEWAGNLRSRFKGGKIAIAVEQKRGPLVYALLKYEFLTIFPLNTTAAKNYRKALRASGAKDDLCDAKLQLLFLRNHVGQLRRLEPASVLTRQLRLLAETRRKMVDQSTAVSNQITALLKDYYPTALELIGNLKTILACDLLDRWPSLERIRQVKPEELKAFYHKNNCRSRKAIENRLRILQQALPLMTEQSIIETYVLILRSLVAQLRILLESISSFDREIEVTFEQHPDYAIYKSLPSGGPVLGPRLAVVFGEDRNRYDSAVAVSNFSGVAPVTLQSGKTKKIVFRHGAPKFVRQSLVEFAGNTVTTSSWARAYYRKCRADGKDHQSAIRALAYKWIRILYRCWKTRTCYDENLYLMALKKKNSPVIKFLNAA